MGFNAWFDGLSPFLKIAVIAGIVIASTAAAGSFIATAVRIWKLFSDAIGRRKK